MRAAGEHKLGVRARRRLGESAIFNNAGNEASLVVRNFSVILRESTLTCPGPRPRTSALLPGVQREQRLGAFSDWNITCPLSGRRKPLRVRRSIAIWAFRGPEAAIRSIFGRLLAAEIL